MKPLGTDWESIKAWFHAALERPADDRAAFVEAALRHQPDVLQEVRTLLTAHDDGASRFERE